MEHPISVERLDPQVAKVCGPGVPAKLKEMTASGLAPLRPRELVTALYVLSYDRDKMIAEKARSSLSAMPASALLGVLEQIEQAEVLDGLTMVLISNESALAKILLNRHTAAETVVHIARVSKHDRTLEIVADNQERLLKHPEIIEALYHNKMARMSTVDRAIELAVRNHIELHGIACFHEVKAAIEGVLISEPTEEPLPDDKAFLNNLESAKWKELDEESVDRAYDEPDQESLGEVKKKVESVEHSLAQLSTSGKIRIASIGNAIQRAVLIRDASKLVVIAVVKSPGLNESEVFRFAKLRSLPEEAVRHIACHRDWTKHYTVKLALVKNPRCPLEYALRFMPHLRLNDLKGLGRDKNVPGAVARAAKQLMSKRI